MVAKSPKREISNFRSHSPISQGVSQLRNAPLAHESISQHSSPISQLRNGLRKWAFSAKMLFRCEIRTPLRKLKTTLGIQFLTTRAKLEQPSIFSLSSEPKPRAPPYISSGQLWQEPEELSPRLRQAARKLQ
ncbi:hypothetical protein CK203_106436 [Vitis vinifera]|uniref:Uncharacterized protein n=1 Tax=Vitis vinifera TaxID=29760 RepID=A0A438DGQ4_VITVI|nr:hypothetical protein CK203_106436 [Vitis vinifera]